MYSVVGKPGFTHRFSADGSRVSFTSTSIDLTTADGNEVEETPGDRHALQENRLYFVSPGSVDASRKRGPRLAECALFDSLERTVEFLRVPYDSAASEAKAIVFGFRINPLTDRLYTLRRRTASAARRIGERLTRAAHTGR